MIQVSVYMVCTYAGQSSFGIGFIAISLGYSTGRLLSFNDRLRDTHSDHPPDLLAFSVIVGLVVRSKIIKVPAPGLFKTIAQDAVYYFLVVFTSHLVFVFFFSFANVSTSSQSSLFFLWLTYTFTEWNHSVHPKFSWLPNSPGLTNALGFSR